MKKFIICLIAIFSLSLQSLKSNDNLNYENLWSELKSLGVKYPDIAFAQAILESGHFKSKVCRTNNNLFGMKLPGQRETVAIGKNLGYAKYSNWSKSVLDYKMWQDYVIKKYKISNRTQYVNMIDKRYAATPNYSTKLKRIIRSFDHII